MKIEFFMVLAIVSTGIMAGIFFTWTNAVTPGIGKLTDLDYLAAFKSMNQAILNPLFFAVFFLPVFIIPLAGILAYKNNMSIEWKMIGFSALIYIAGCLCVTVAGNVPLNEMLERSSLNAYNNEQLKQLRSSIEVKWNVLNLIRTVSSSFAFLFLVLSMCLKK